MAVYAALSDVQDAYESTIPAERNAWVQNLIERASRLLDARVPSLAGRLAAQTQDAFAVKDAIVAAVLRVFRNPEGVGSETEGNYLYSLNRDVAAGKLYFTGDDLALVGGSSGTAYGRSFRSPITR